MTESADTVLVVDDEAGVRRLLKRALEKEAFKVLEAADGSQMREHLTSNHIDLITLDLSLGPESGLELAREIRQSSRIPIIMVSGKGELIDTVVGLEIGADDYISKPFELREVVARIRAVLRRYPKSNGDAQSITESSAQAGKYLFLEWTLDTAIRELRHSNQQVCELTTSEYDLLYLLVRHARQVLSRDQIMDHLKGIEWSPNDRTVDNQIARLRKKLHSVSDGGTVIKTVRGAGYLFTPEVLKRA
ncbi:MAG: response regulator [Gammaproteobacteria bacterium]|nr:response regulator [Gammaproteobacteria bacterium]